MSDHLRNELREASRRALRRPVLQAGDGHEERFRVIERHLTGAGIVLDDEARRTLRWMAGHNPESVACLVSLMLTGRPAPLATTGGVS